jgi:hypothetical protein
MVNYQNGKIYAIRPIGMESPTYVGSTTKRLLSQRIAEHRCRYRRWKSECDKYCTSFDIFDKYGLENCKIELIEKYPCNGKDELEQRECHFIRTIECVNKTEPGIGRLKAFKKYYEKNKERISIIHQKRYEKNREIMKEKTNQYYEDNKETILKQNKCPCGGCFTNMNKAKHSKTKIHMNYMMTTVNNNI